MVIAATDLFSRATYASENGNTAKRRFAHKAKRIGNKLYALAKFRHTIRLWGLIRLIAFECIKHFFTWKFAIVIAHLCATFQNTYNCQVKIGWFVCLIYIKILFICTQKYMGKVLFLIGWKIKGIKETKILIYLLHTVI